MRAPLSGLLRPARLGLAAVGLVLAAGACADPATPSDPVPAPPAPTSSLEPLNGIHGTAGSDGLTVRYLDHGTVKTVRVEDFPR